LREEAGETKYAVESTEFVPISAGERSSGLGSKKDLANDRKAHHDFLIKEILWMQEDFDRERKKKQGDAKK
jgi:hypothetical protein